ncbi:MAG: DUF6625 family protein, partial [Flavobacteriales bacterium]
MKTDHSICLLIPYYGKWPVYLNLFLASCKGHDNLQVHLISDLSLSQENKPNNVHLVNISLADLVVRMNTKLGLNLTEIQPRKICDFKPAYGLLFDELTEGFDFWAYGDVDMVFGNLKRYLKPEILNVNDILTFREEWIHGPFTIFRNNEYTKTLFKKSKDWLKVFSSETLFCFDECGKKHRILRTGIDPLDIEVPVAPNDIHDMTQVIRAEEIDGKLKIYRRYYAKESLPFDEIIWWNNGKIEGAGFAEYIFYHFVWDKFQKQFVFPNWKTIPDRYFITTTGFYLP